MIWNNVVMHIGWKFPLMEETPGPNWGMPAAERIGTTMPPAGGGMVRAQVGKPPAIPFPELREETMSGSGL